MVGVGVGGRRACGPRPRPRRPTPLHPHRAHPPAQVVINCNALPCLLNLLTTAAKKSIKKEACWTVSNITAGTKDQIQAVIEAGLVPPLVGLLATAEFDIKKAREGGGGVVAWVCIRVGGLAGQGRAGGPGPDPHGCDRHAP